MIEDNHSGQDTEAVMSVPDAEPTIDDPATDLLVEEISIDGMCGVY